MCARIVMVLPYTGKPYPYGYYMATHDKSPLLRTVCMASGDEVPQLGLL